jgi:hypothetical protein
MFQLELLVPSFFLTCHKMSVGLKIMRSEAAEMRISYSYLNKLCDEATEITY